jgi:diguanylate cyclase (GGDEF)-like protein
VQIESRRPWQWQVFAVAGTVAVAVYLADLSALAESIAFAATGVATVLVCFAGPRRYGTEPAAVWPLIGTAALSFLAGVVLRSTTTATRWELIADSATILGYALLAVAAGWLLHSRQRIERHVVLDAVIVCLAGGLVSALVLVVPTIEAAGGSNALSLLAGLYPLFDIVLVLLVANLTFTAVHWPTGLVTLIATLSLMAAGDLAYAVLGASGISFSTPLLNAPFLVAYVLLGVTALHPSVVELSHAGRHAVAAWSWRRMLLLGPALVVPFVLLVTAGGRGPGWRLAIGGTGLVMVALLVVRALSVVRAEAAAQLYSEHQAMHDPLTGLPNRRMLAAEVQRMLTLSGPDGPQHVWVCLLDLDDFKWINDSWGHDTGDQVVMEAAARLRDALPASAMLARVGGDEFLLAYAGDKMAALHLVDEMQGCFERPMPVHDTEVMVTASIGLAHAADEGNPALTAETLMRDADTAMYRSKGEGPGRATIFDTSMHDRVKERIELEAALRGALIGDELHVAYQPIVRLETGKPIGAEALVHWDHPTRGAIPPMSFLPVAEEAGLIGAIGAWARVEALRQLADWRADGTVGDDFFMSINVSPRQLNDAELPLHIAAELLQYGLPARAMALEMTEPVLVEGSSVTTRVLYELRELGVRLMVDDFGTGISALGNLRKFPVTGVKIDRSFVAGLGQHPEDEEIIRAVVAMSHALGLSIVAEGVETRAQRDILAAVGVPQGQGWLWGPAVSAGDFVAHWHATPPARLGNPAARIRPVTSGM